MRDYSIIRKADLEFTRGAHQSDGVLRARQFAGDNEQNLPQITSVSMGPETSVPAHFHRGLCEYFFILKGEVVCILGGAEFHSLGVGDLLVVPELTVHELRNPSSECSELLITGCKTGPSVTTEHVRDQN